MMYLVHNHQAILVEKLYQFFFLFVRIRGQQTNLLGGEALGVSLIICRKLYCGIFKSIENFVCCGHRTRKTEPFLIWCTG